MADAKISQLPDGGAIQPSDQVPVNRAGTTVRATGAGGGSSLPTVPGVGPGVATAQASINGTAGQNKRQLLLETADVQTNPAFTVFDSGGTECVSLHGDHVAYLAAARNNQTILFLDGQAAPSQTADIIHAEDKNGVRALRITADGAVIMAGLPTADPHVVGQLWSNSGVVTVSAG